MDVMLVEIERADRFLGKSAPFRWYAWNRPEYGQGSDPTADRVTIDRGLVYQDYSLGSDIVRGQRLDPAP